jgi:Zn-dependent M28 family amino/carboxypeptidase
MVQIGRLIRSATIVSLTILVCACNPTRNQEPALELAEAPEFNADSAFHFVATQTSFGPRVPGSEAHDQSGNYLVKTLASFGFVVTEQKDSVPSFSNTLLPLRNIVAVFNPNAKKRILLAAHWDTRPYADRDDTLKTKPFDGANDGASGVGVLLEIARCVASMPPSIGLDIILFDLEDQGRAAYDSLHNETEHYFCLGSRYWASHLSGYTADYGIVLDMVGAANAKFTMEGASMKYAEPIVRKVWGVGNKLGYSSHFRYNRTPYIIDDHNYVSEVAGIPCIDIIQHDASTETGFWNLWHTHDDNLTAIDRKTLKAVGQTVLQTIYND